MAGKIEKRVTPFEKDDLIIQEGTPPHSEIYFLVKGQAIAEMKGRVVGTIKQGEWFGELAAILGIMRTASVRAASKCEVLVFKGLDDAELAETMQRDPKLVRKLVAQLATRVKDTSERHAREVEALNVRVAQLEGAVAGTLFVLEKLSEKFKSKVMQEVLEHLKGKSGVVMGDGAKADLNYFVAGKQAIGG